LGSAEESSESAKIGHFDPLETHWRDLYGWLIRRAELDLTVARQLQNVENATLHHIRQLEQSLAAQIGAFQKHFSELQDRAISNLNNVVVSCADKLAEFQATYPPATELNDFLQTLHTLQADLPHKLGELHNTQSILQHEREIIRQRLQQVEIEITARANCITVVADDSRYLKAETKALAERLVQLESAIWQSRITALQTAQKLERAEVRIVNQQTHIEAGLKFAQRARRFRLLFRTIRRLSTKIRRLQQQAVQHQYANSTHEIQLQELHGTISGVTERLEYLNNALTQVVPQNQYEVFASSIRRDINEVKSKITQRLLLIEARNEERQRRVNELAASIQNQLCEHGRKEGLDVTEHNFRDIQLEFANVLKRVNELEILIPEAIATLQRETAHASAAAQRCDQVNEQLLEAQRQFSARITDLDQRLAVQHAEGEHWTRGFRESLARELSAVHARLTDRCTGLSHQYETAARWQNTTDATLRSLEQTVRELSQPQSGPDPELRNIAQQLHSLHCRVDATETRHAETAERLTSAIDDTQQVIKAGIETHLEQQFQVLAAHIYDQFALDKTQITEQLKSLREAFERVAYDIDLAKQACANVHSASGLSRMIEAMIDNKADQLQGGVAQQIQSLQEQHTRFASATTSAIETLRADLACRNQLASEELQTNTFNGPLQSLSSEVQRMSQTLLTRAAAIEQQHVTDYDTTERAIRELHAEVRLVREELHQSRTDYDYNKRLTQIETTISAKMDNIRLYIEDEFARTGIRGAGVVGIRQGVDRTFDNLSALSRVEQPTLSSAADTDPTSTTVVPTMTADSKPFYSSAIADSASINNNAEQLEELQERMAAEIARVRAELKERKGRWKVRRSGA
jgi:chromosome segregation ATPase